jgi:hypothetical protein
MINFSRFWRYWILGLTLLALISIQIIESTHHHETADQLNDCAVCQFVMHQQIDEHSPVDAPLGPVLFFLYIILSFKYVFRVVDAGFTPYDSRAPPHSS